MMHSLNFKHLSKIFSTFWLFCISLSIAIAQTSCPTIIRSTLETVASTCNFSGRNQVCYGNDSLVVLPRETTSSLSFEQAGDLIRTEDVQSLELSPMNLSDGTWAVALINVQANLPASADENLTMLLFGEGKLDNRGDAVQVAGTIGAPNPVNVRSAPTTEGAIVSILSPGSSVTLNGRTANSDWLCLTSASLGQNLRIE